MVGEQIHLLESFGYCKSPRSVTHDHHVIGLLHDRLRQSRNVFDPAHARDRSGAVRRPVHHAGIQLHFPFFVGQSAVANGVVVRIVLNDRYSGNDGVQRVATFLENVHPSTQRVKSIGAGNNERSLALRGGREIRKSGQVAAVRMRPSEQFAGARNSAPGKRSKKKFTA